MGCRAQAIGGYFFVSYASSWGRTSTWLLRGAAAFTEVHHRLTERTGTSTSEDSR
jgi:hypothetical protein